MTASTTVTEFTMPSLGADMDAGTVLEWLVSPGDEVHRGQVVAVVDTAKAAIEIEVFSAGVVREILVEPGTKVAVGTPLATIEVPLAAAEARAPVSPTRSVRVAKPPVRHLAHELGLDVESISGTGPGGTVTRQDVLSAARRAEQAGQAEQTEPAGRAGEATVAPGPSGPPTPGLPGTRPRVTPRARRTADELGVDLARVIGTGSGGAITDADVRAAASAAAAAPETAARRAPEPSAAGAEPGPEPAGEPAAEPGPPAARRPAVRRSRESQEAMRAAIAALMARSKREIPHYYVSLTIDMTPALDWLTGYNADRPVKNRILPAALLARAVVVALATTPQLNGHWEDGRLHSADHVDLGIAVALRGGGMVAPAIMAAEQLDLSTLMGRLSDLVRRARAGRLRQSEMAGGSITVSNLGESGAEGLAGVIYPPQVALVGIGGIAERPWAISGMLAVRRTVTVTVAADHRASDGRTGSAFLAALAETLTKPEEL